MCTFLAYVAFHRFVFLNASSHLFLIYPSRWHTNTDIKGCVNESLRAVRILRQMEILQSNCCWIPGKIWSTVDMWSGWGCLLFLGTAAWILHKDQAVYDQPTNHPTTQHTHTHTHTYTHNTLHSGFGMMTLYLSLQSEQHGSIMGGMTVQCWWSPN